MADRSEWAIGEGGESDAAQILTLRRAVFGELEKDKQDRRFWTWEFLGGPDGKAFIYKAEDRGKLVAHFADLPRRFCVDGREVPGTLSLDLMVDAGYRRKGLFAALGKFAASQVQRGGRLFMTAFPIREETIRGLVKIGWKPVEELPVLVYPLRFKGIVGHYLPLRPLSGLLGATADLLFSLFGAMKGGRGNQGDQVVEIEEAAGLDETFDLFWKRAHSLFPCMGVRDRAHLTYRYFEHPTRSYVFYRASRRREMTGYIVLRKVDLLGFNSSVVVDLLALEEDSWSALVDKGLARSRRDGSDLVGFMVPRRHLYYRNLRRKGFLPSLKKFLFMVYPLTEDKALLSEGKWYATWGDTDVI
jgi:hypothetical protein